jgi:hypothetical protein
MGGIWDNHETVYIHIIIDVQGEELDSDRMKENYKTVLSKHPKGNFQKKSVRGKVYDYIAYRKKGKAKYEITYRIFKIMV